MRTGVIVLVVAMVGLFGSFGGSRFAQAYNAHAGTSYYLRDNFGKKAYLWPTGTWDHWSGSTQIVDVSISTQVNVMNSDTLSCWYVAIVGPYQDQNTESAARTMNYGNTPVLHTKYWATAWVGGDAEWEVAFSFVGETGCTYWTIAQGASNGFFVNVGATTGSDDPYPNYITSYP